MTVPTSTAKSGPYAGSGTTGPFTVGFRFLENSHIQVIKTSTTGTDTTLALTADYTVSGAGGASGTVTLLTALAVGEKLTIVRNVPFTQDADYVQNDAFPAESHERALDKLTMQTQQLAETVSRAATVPVTSTDAAGLAAAISTLAANTDSVTSVADNMDDVNTLADNINDVNTVAENILDVTNFADVYQGPKAADPTLRNDGFALAVGDLYFNTANGVMRVYSGASWSNVGTALPVTVVEQTFNGTGSQTTFTLSSAPPYLTAVEVFVSGVRQVATTVFSVFGTTLTFTTAPPSGTANIYVRWLTPVAAGVPTDGTVTTAKIVDGAVTTGKVADGAITAGKVAGGVAVANLGFSPVQQGTGTGQLSNTVKIGWDGGWLLSEVDATNFGNDWPINSRNGARAWVNFNGTGTVSIRAAHNVSSVTDNGVGDYTVNFTNYMQDDNFAVSLAYSSEINGQHAVGFLQGLGINGVRVQHYNAANSSQAADKSIVNVAVFR